MGREDYQELKSGVLKRKTKRKLGLFIDGTSLDRATRRLERKIDLAKLVAGVTAGLQPEIARYYTLVPYEDDSRQFAFLDAVERAGLEVVIKRLPPKGVKRQVSMDVHIASDIIAFSVGVFDRPAGAEAPNLGSGSGFKNGHPAAAGSVLPGESDTTSSLIVPRYSESAHQDLKRIAAVVCPSRELSYAIFLSHKMHVETQLADFGLYGTSDGWKGVDRWIDLSTSETIWRE